jgi:hypothetical protein
MLTKYDPEYARGVRAPGAVPTRSAWLDVQALRKAALAYEKTLERILPEGMEINTVRANFDAVASYAEVVVMRYDRSGPPENQSDVADMEATLRMAAKNPEQFRAFDVDGLKKAAAALRKKL